MQTQTWNLLIRFQFFLFGAACSVYFMGAENEPESGSLQSLYMTLGAIFHCCIMLVFFPMLQQLRFIFFFPQPAREGVAGIQNVQWLIFPEWFIVIGSIIMSIMYMGMGFVSTRAFWLTFVLGALYLTTSRFLQNIFLWVRHLGYVFSSTPRDVEASLYDEIRAAMNTLHSQIVSEPRVEYPRGLRYLANVFLLFQLAFSVQLYSGYYVNWLTIVIPTACILQMLVGFPRGPEKDEWRFIMVTSTLHSSIVLYNQGHDDLLFHVAIIIFVMQLLPLYYAVWLDVKDTHLLYPRFYFGCRDENVGLDAGEHHDLEGQNPIQ